MTPMSENPVAVTQALLPVIQADRDAAADYAREHWLWPAPHVEGIRIGSEAWDAYHLTQAFARHRLAGLEREADDAPGGGEAATLVRAALHDADDISERIVAGGYRGNVSDTETLRNHVRKLAAALTKPTPPASVSGEGAFTVTIFASGDGENTAAEAVHHALAAAYRAGHCITWSEPIAAAPEAATPSAGLDREDIARVLFDQRQTSHDFDDAADADPESDAGTLRSIVFDDADAVLRLFERESGRAPSAIGGVNWMREEAIEEIEALMQEPVIAKCDGIAALGIAMTRIAALATGETSPERTHIDERHRYLIKRNADGMFVGSTDDLGAILPPGHRLIDTIGEDGAGLGIAHYLKSGAALNEQPRTSEGGKPSTGDIS